MNIQRCRESLGPRTYGIREGLSLGRDTRVSTIDLLAMSSYDGQTLMNIPPRRPPYVTWLSMHADKDVYVDLSVYSISSPRQGSSPRTTSGSGDWRGRLFPRILPILVLTQAHGVFQSSGLYCMRAA